MTPLVLIRDGTIFGPQGTEIDLRTPDYSVWLRVAAEKDADAEAVVAVLEAAFPAERPEGREGMVTVYDYQDRYLGCMGIETWRDLLAERPESAPTKGREGPPR